MRARGMKAYMGFFMVNYLNTKPPLKDWFDDAGWQTTVLPRIRDLSGAAKLKALSGDEEEKTALAAGERTA